MINKLLAFVLAVVPGLSAEAKYRPGWAKARQIFLRKAMSDPRQPKSIRGYLRNQDRAWKRSGKKGLTRFKNPKGYDIGHNPMYRGSNNPKHLRFETANDNRSRPQRAKARGRRLGRPVNHY
jgi:hypothetical protein